MFESGMHKQWFVPTFKRANLSSSPYQITCEIQLKTTRILALQALKAHSAMPWPPLEELTPHKTGL